MELRSDELGYSVDLQVGNDVYLEFPLIPDAVFLDWKKLPEPVRDELKTIHNELRGKLSRCAELINQNCHCAVDVD